MPRGAVVVVRILLFMFLCAELKKLLNKRCSNIENEISSEQIPGRGSGFNIQVKHTFKGEGAEIWSEFIRYFENIAMLNQWTLDMKRRVLITTFRGQAETFAYGLSEDVLEDYNQLKQSMDDRFGQSCHEGKLHR
jgi:hypothetical protein